MLLLQAQQSANRIYIIVILYCISPDKKFAPKFCNIQFYFGQTSMSRYNVEGRGIRAL